MTNQEIIWNARCKLMELGELQPTGRTVTVGEKVLEEPEEIHTFNAWKRLGYSVKKGEHAVAKFEIWKFKETGRKAKPEDDGDDEKAPEKPDSGYCYMKMAFFFSRAQVEPLKKR